MKRVPSAVLIVLAALALVLGAQTQTKAPATFADFGKWETLAPAGARGGFSPDGRWLAYGINRSNRENELRIAKLADGATKTVAFGAQPSFSADSKWAAYSIGVSEADQEKLRSEQKPVQNKLGLMNLATGDMTTIDGVESFVFSQDGAFLAMQRYAPVRAGAAPGPAAAPRGGPGGGPSEAADERPGTTLIVRDLAKGSDITFGNISQFAWQDAERTHLLAMIVSAESKTGNGVQLFDPATGSLRALDSSPSIYANLAWRKDAADLAVFRAKTDDKKDGPTQIVLAWTGLGSKQDIRRTYDPTADKTFPAGMRTVTFRRLAWSADGKTVFLGLAKWDDLPAPPAKDKEGEKPADKVPAARPSRGGAGSPGSEASTVEIWHFKDVFVMPLQKMTAAQDRRRNLLAAWHLASGKLVQLGQDFVNEQVTPVRGTQLATVAEWSKYAFNRTIGRPAADLYLADLATGARTKVQEKINDRYLQASPGGKFLLFLLDNHYWTVNLATRAVTNITKSAPVSFINAESDETIEQKPPFGVAGWVKDDAAVLLYDKYDIWKVAPDGSKAQRLTNGAAEEVRHRLVRLDLAGMGFFRGGGMFGAAAPDQGVDPAKPQYLSLYGEWTKKSGYGLLKPSGEVSRLIWLDKGVGSLAKAKDAEIYGYVLQDYDVSPNILVCGPDLKNGKAATNTNPFQKDFAWGRSELIDYKTDQGRRLQGALLYPAGYVQGRKYPMIVYNYELLSQMVHSYVAPSDRSYYNLSVFTSLGYLVLQPDIVFRPRQPGWSVVECVTAGVRKVIDMGVVDPKRIGIVGHSMGGFDAAFVATNTHGVFAAAVAGAPIIDMVSYYGDHHWSSGIAETDHIETGQERMEVPLYEDLKDYIDNSPYFNTAKMDVPLLLECGDQDGTVAWHQSIELYNVARRAGKNVVMLAYMGEDHGLRQAKNQTDYQRRILAWFGHYLKGETAEPWIVSGQSYLDRQAEIKRQTEKK